MFEVTNSLFLASLCSVLPLPATTAFRSTPQALIPDKPPVLFNNDYGCTKLLFSPTPHTKDII